MDKKEAFKLLSGAVFGIAKATLFSPKKEKLKQLLSEAKGVIAKVEEFVETLE